MSQQEVWTFASNSELKIVEKEEKKTRNGRIHPPKVLLYTFRFVNGGVQIHEKILGKILACG